MSSRSGFQVSFVEPMECLMVSRLPESPEWTYEIKLDGYRAQALCDRKNVRLLSRNGKDLGQRFPALLSELAAAIPNGSVVDGELVALDSFGRPSFSQIQQPAALPSFSLPSIFYTLRASTSPANHCPNDAHCCARR